MTERIILAIDLGTSSMKVALVSLAGQILGWESEPLRLYLTQDGGAEQNPNEWWAAFLSAAGRLIKRNIVPAEAIHAICCSTQGEGTIPIDKDGKVLMNCILWMDMRGASNLKKQFKGFINIDGVNIFKVLRWVRLTGGMPSPTGKDPSAHMLFIRDHFPEIYAHTYKFLNVLDFLNFRLTGRYAATFDSILTSWVTDNRNPNSVHYDKTLVNESGIDANKFPEIVPCTEIFGNLQAEVARTLGLSTSVQVIAGSIDNTAAAIGSGKVEDFGVHLYLGTSSWMAAHVPFKKTDFSSSMASVPCAVPGRYLLTALQATAGGNLTFLRDNILYHKDELLQETEVPDIFKYLDQMAGRVPAGSNGIIYTPWIWGERAPVDDKHLRAGLLNISLQNTREDIIRAFLEGVALNSRWLLAPVEKFVGHKVNHINIVGGGAQSDVWCQIYADVLNINISQVRDPIYANVRGAAWIAAVGLGEIAFNDVPNLIEIKETYVPNPVNSKQYNEKFEAFVQIYKQMKGVYKEINKQT